MSNVNEIYGGLLCFNDSYFIPYYHFDAKIGGKAIDMEIIGPQRNKIYDKVQLLSVNTTIPRDYRELFSIKGGTNSI